MSDHMAGITDQTIVMEVSAGQFEIFASELPVPGRPRTTHKVGVGPFVIPGLYVVVAVRQDTEPPKTRYWATLAKVES